MADDSKPATDCRTFIKQATGSMIGAGLTARPYRRALGANDRIRIAQLGCGSRSEGHVHMVQIASRHTPVETVAVCDVWKLARERRAAQVKRGFDVDAKFYKYSEEMLANKEIDGVMIATAQAELQRSGPYHELAHSHANENPAQCQRVPRILALHRNHHGRAPNPTGAASGSTGTLRPKRSSISQ